MTGVPIPLSDNATFDVVVIGAGAAGMAAAAFAAIEGQRTLLVERTEFLGGTSAYSAATAWIPNTHHAASVGAEDSFDKAARFLDAVVGNRSPADLRSAFLRAGPEAVTALERETSVRFRPYALHPDYEQEAEGATLRGRALEPVPFDGRSLGAALDLIRPPIPEFTLFGGMMVDRTDIGHLLNAAKNLKSLRHSLGILGHYARDRLAGKRRGSRLVMGNALIGRLLKTLLDRGVTIATETEVADIAIGADGVRTVVLAQDDARRSVTVARALVLAGGGFGRDPARRTQLLHQPVPEFSPTAPGHTGRAQALAVKLGARFGTGAEDSAFWAPVSLRPRADGSTAVFPHFVLDRSKPGTVCVNGRGARFVNESVSYHRFTRAMFQAHRSEPTIPATIICDAVALRKYGLGMVRMGTRNLRPFLADGYLVEAPSIPDLARRLGMDVATLERTIADMNTFAETGIDTEYGRGTTAYHRVNGDASHGPNPTLGPIATAPFYAVRLHPGDIGAATGLAIDADARVLGESNAPICRLYACGNEAQSIMGGVYPGPGITIGPAITFAYRAIRHAVHGAATGRADG